MRPQARLQVGHLPPVRVSVSFCDRVSGCLVCVGVRGRRPLYAGLAGLKLGQLAFALEVHPIAVLLEHREVLLQGTDHPLRVCASVLVGQAVR